MHSLVASRPKCRSGRCLLSGEHTGEEAPTQGLEFWQGELTFIRLCLRMCPCVPAAIPPLCSHCGCLRCRSVLGCPQCPIPGGLSYVQECAWLSPVPHSRQAVPSVPSQVGCPISSKQRVLPGCCTAPRPRSEITTQVPDGNIS